MTTPAEVKAPDLSLASGDTGSMTIMITGEAVSGGINPIWIALPGSGSLQVIYEYQDQPAATAILWHQGGAYENLVPGSQTYNSQSGDALFFSMAYATQSIKVGWAYV